MGCEIQPSYKPLKVICKIWDCIGKGDEGSTSHNSDYSRIKLQPLDIIQEFLGWYCYFGNRNEHVNNNTTMSLTFAIKIDLIRVNVICTYQPTFDIMSKPQRKICWYDGSWLRSLIYCNSQSSYFDSQPNIQLWTIWLRPRAHFPIKGQKDDVNC